MENGDFNGHMHVQQGARGDSVHMLMMGTIHKQCFYGVYKAWETFCNSAFG